MARLSPSLQSIESIKEVTAQPLRVTKSHTIQRAVGHPSKIKSDADLPLERRKQPAPVPVADVRYDNVAH